MSVVSFGSDAYFNASTRDYQYFPDNTCIGASWGSFLYRCNSGGDVISMVEFNGSDCSGTMTTSSLNVSAGPASPSGGDTYYYDCACVPEVPGQTEYIIEVANYNDSECTVPCDGTNGCDDSEYAVMVGTDIQSSDGCFQFRVHSGAAMFDMYYATDTDCSDAARFYDYMQVDRPSGYCESQGDGAYRKYTIQDLSLIHI